MEFRALVAQVIDSFSQLLEVLDGLGNGFAEETNDNTADFLIADFDVEEDFVSDLQLIITLKRNTIEP